MGGAVRRAGHRTPMPGGRRLALGVIGALALAVAACGVRIGSIDMRFGNIDLSLDSGIGTATTVVVRNPTDWARLWRDHDSRILPSRPLPFVDFGQDIVVAIFLGQRTDRCHEVRIERVLLFDDNHIVVRYRELVVASGTACAFGLSWPSTIVRIPFTGLPVRFEHLGTSILE